MKYYLGLDNGGTTTKAALYTYDGEEVAVASAATKAILPKPSHVERDMEEMWLSNCHVIQQVLELSAVDPRLIRAVSICGHGKGLYLWGKNGKPVRNGILSSDNRAYQYPFAWRDCGSEARLFPITGQRILACQPAALLSWLRDCEPETVPGVAWIFGAKDYVRFRLTGVANAEITDCSGNGFLNLQTRTYDEEILRQLGLEEFQCALPPLCESLEVCGHVTETAAAQCGLAPGTPVIGGMFDINACALTANVTDESSLCMIAGTWSINEYLSQAPVMDGTVMMNSLFAIPGYYLIEESSPTSAGNNEWFVRQILPELAEACERQGGNIYEQLNQWAEEIPVGEICPIFLPFLMASNVHPNARGCLFGITGAHTRKHLARSIYEGIAFGHRHHYERLMISRKDKPQQIRLAGGAARSPVWSQIFADVMELPVETVAAQETGTLGCAIAAAVAMGDYEDVAQAAAHMSKVVQRYTPSAANRQIYREKYRLYRQVIDALDPLWDNFQALMECV